ncbi:MAG: PhzF family phenazine biosynthesis isomerase [Actinobacteria bacterium]|nr:PhzF family phenazine biosynthesis isomerase [Actinomycetota bacterium]
MRGDQERHRGCPVVAGGFGSRTDVAMRFLQVDVFNDAAYLGNQLAVFPDAGELTTEQMQTIAKEMNLSETTFASEVDEDGYTVRIFTPGGELPFAGHPTIGTSWVMRHLGWITSDRLVQRSKAGDTPIEWRSGRIWFQRTGTTKADLRDQDVSIGATIAGAVGVAEEALFLEARELGRHGQLYPAMADTGVEQLLVPVSDLASLEGAFPSLEHMKKLPGIGAYCFTTASAGSIRARFFAPEIGVLEDPATGSAAGSLGVYLADRLGPIEFEIVQGVEMGRESHIHVKAEPGRVQVGGECALALEGELAALP